MHIQWPIFSLKVEYPTLGQGLNILSPARHFWNMVESLIDGLCRVFLGYFVLGNCGTWVSVFRSLIKWAILLHSASLHIPSKRSKWPWTETSKGVGQNNPPFHKNAKWTSKIFGSHTYMRLGTWELKAGVLEVQCYSQVFSESEVSLCYMGWDSVSKRPKPTIIVCVIICIKKNEAFVSICDFINKFMMIRNISSNENTRFFKYHTKEKTKSK